MNFTNSSYSVGFGAAFNITERIRLNAGVMPTFYDAVTNTAVDPASGLKFTDVFDRTSISWGFGLDFHFGRK
jgi:hypothetical protein